MLKRLCSQGFFPSVCLSFEKKSMCEDKIVVFLIIIFLIRHYGALCS